MRRNTRGIVAPCLRLSTCSEQSWCVHAFKRTPAQNSGGSTLPTIDCSGSYSYFLLHACMSAQGVTAVPTVYVQYYGRDPFIIDGTGASLSNGLVFTVCP
jgi:hypothetical protein